MMTEWTSHYTYQSRINVFRPPWLHQLARVSLTLQQHIYNITISFSNWFNLTLVNLHLHKGQLFHTYEVRSGKASDSMMWLRGEANSRKRQIRAKMTMTSRNNQDPNIAYHQCILEEKLCSLYLLYITVATKPPNPFTKLCHPSLLQQINNFGKIYLLMVN